MEKFIFSKASTKVFKRSNKCACGKPAIICALDNHGSDDARDHELLGLFCADCGLEGIRNLPRSSWLHISESHVPRQTRDSMRRKYKVYSLNERANRADIVVIDGTNQFLCGQRLNTRLDAVPPQSRIIDAIFEVDGSSVEIDLFEHSGVSASGD